MRPRVEYLTDGVLRREPPHASRPTSKTLRVNFACAVFKRKVDKGKIGELLSAQIFGGCANATRHPSSLTTLYRDKWLR